MAEDIINHYERNYSNMNNYDKIEVTMKNIQHVDLEFNKINVQLNLYQKMYDDFKKILIEKDPLKKSRSPTPKSKDRPSKYTRIMSDVEAKMYLNNLDKQIKKLYIHAQYLDNVRRGLVVYSTYLNQGIKRSKIY
jgi:hypothetical protein